MQHLFLKIAALACGIFLWFFVSTQKVYQETLDLPIAWKGLNPHLALCGRAPNTVKVTLEGSGLELLRSKQHLGVMEVDLSNAVLGDNTYSFTLSNYKNFDGESKVKAIAIHTPKQITLDIDSRVYKKVPIRSTVRFESAPNHLVIGKAMLEPSLITLSGGRKELTRIFEVTTTAQLFKGLTQDTSVYAPLDTAYNGRILFSNTQVKVSQKIEALQSKIFHNIPVRLISPAPLQGYSLSPTQAEVTLTGGRNSLKMLTAEHIHLYVEFSRFAIEGKNLLEPTVSIDQEVKSYRITPQFFKLVAKSNAL